MGYLTVTNTDTLQIKLDKQIPTLILFLSLHYKIR